MALALAGLALLLLSGALAGLAAMPPAGVFSTWPGRLLRSALGMSLALALVPAATWLGLRAGLGGVADRGTLLGMDLAVCVAVSALAGLRLRGTPADRRRITTSPAADSRPATAGVETPVSRGARRAFLATAAIAVALAAGSHAAISLGHAHTDTHDGYAIWNTHARLLFHAPPGDIHRAFDRDVHHADYPLLLPAAVVRLWIWAGADPPAVPAVLSGVFGLITVFILFGAVAVVRDQTAAAIAVLVLLGSRYFVREAASQCADVPLSLFVLGALSAIVLHDRVGGAGRRWLVVAGLLAGSAAWTKNEGLIAGGGLFLARGLASAFTRPRSGFGRESASLAAGALPPLALFTAFKAGLGVGNDMVAGLSIPAVRDRIADSARHVVVASGLFTKCLAVGRPVLPILLAILAFSMAGAARLRSLPVRTAGLLPVLLLLAAYGIYLLTPHDPGWHLETSATRLLVQIWPGFVFASLLISGGVEPESNPFPA